MFNYTSPDPLITDKLFILASYSSMIFVDFSLSEIFKLIDVNPIIKTKEKKGIDKNGITINYD